MEESSISPPFTRHGGHSPYFRVTYLLFFFSVFFMIKVQSVPGSDLQEISPPETETTFQPVTLANTPIAIAPVKKSKSDRFDPIVESAAECYEVDSALIKAIIMAESAYDPRAVSKQGAQGLMQLMPGTARALGVKNAFNPTHNIHGGVKYLRQLLDVFNDNIKLALAAYNAGINMVKRHGGMPPITATKRYVKKVVAYYHHYKAEMEDKTENV